MEVNVSGVKGQAWLCSEIEASLGYIKKKRKKKKNFYMNTTYEIRRVLMNMQYTNNHATQLSTGRV